MALGQGTRRADAVASGAVPGTAAFRSALADALPERPFRVVLWDGTDVPSTEDNGGPTFTARSPQALAHVLRAPAATASSSWRSVRPRPSRVPGSSSSRRRRAGAR